MHCGAPLGSSAPPTPPPYTPGHLRDRVLITRSALEGERKQVTVLFVDIKDSVALSSRVGPDQWHEILEHFFRALSTEVHRHEGTINQYTGDGIMALWSAPIADEHHADRACRAALAIRETVSRLNPELRERHGIELLVRMGINSGEAVVGRIGDDLRSDYTAKGPTVGLAARMEASCEPGEILLTEHTARLLPPGYELEVCGELAIKGSEPIKAYALRALVEGRLSAVLRRHQAAGPFFGRALELATLQRALESAASGKGQVIGVSGDAGIGKTRLCGEFLSRCAAAGLPTHATRCAAHERHRPLSSLLPLLRGFFGLTGRAPPEAQRATIGDALGKWLGHVLPLVWAALEVADAGAEQPVMDPEARRRRLHGALASAFERAPPGLLFIDDAHFIDPASDELLATLVAAVGKSRMLLVLDFRPDYGAAWMKSPHYAELRLPPLDAADAQLLLTQRAGRDPSLGELKAMIHDQARGNPLFIEEILRSLAESAALSGGPGAYRLQKPLSELSVPASVQSILAARVDRLGEQPKRLLQTAAAIGSEFTLELLSAVTELAPAVVSAGISVLESSDFVESVDDAPDARFAFRAPLLREVAYGALLVQHRKALHAKIAIALLRDAERSRTTEAAIVAHHFEAADEPVRAAEYYRLAANRAGYADADRSHVYWEKAAELAATRPEIEIANRHELAAHMRMLELGWQRGIERATADRLYTRAQALIERVGTGAMLASLHASYGRALAALAGAEAYLDHAREALRIAQREGDPTLIASMGAVYGQALCRSGQLQAGVEAFDGILNAAQPEPAFDASLSAFIRSLRGHALMLLGRFGEAQADLEACLRVADARGEIDLLIAPRLSWVELAHCRGEHADVERVALEAMDLADQLGNSIARVHAHVARAVAFIAFGAAREAEQALRTAIALGADRLSSMEGGSRVHRYLAESLLLQERLAEAEHAARAAVEHAGALESQVGEAQALIALAHARLGASAQDAGADAARLLERAAQLADKTATRSVSAEIALARAQLAAVRNAEAERRAELARAQELFVAMGAPARAASVRRMLESVTPVQPSH